MLGAALGWLSGPSAAQAEDAARAAQDREEPLPTQLTAEGGDSWTKLRAMFCPLEVLLEANPRVAARQLQAGDRIQSPFVRASQLQGANVALGELQSRLQGERDRSAALEVQVASIEGLRAELARAREAEVAADRLRSMLTIAAGAALVLMIVAGAIALLMRQESLRTARRMSEAEERYAELRRSLQGLEVQLQKRALDLIAVHKGPEVATEHAAQMALPVLELAERIRRRHAS